MIQIFYRDNWNFLDLIQDLNASESWALLYPAIPSRAKYEIKSDQIVGNDACPCLGDVKEQHGLA